MFRIAAYTSWVAAELSLTKGRDMPLNEEGFIYLYRKSSIASFRRLPANLPLAGRFEEGFSHASEGCDALCRPQLFQKFAATRS
jgi:hypothetical protein